MNRAEYKLRGFYRTSEARKRAPVVSRPDLVAERNAPTTWDGELIADIPDQYERDTRARIARQSEAMDFNRMKRHQRAVVEDAVAYRATLDTYGGNVVLLTVVEQVAAHIELLIFHHADMLSESVY